MEDRDSFLHDLAGSFAIRGAGAFSLFGRQHSVADGERPEGARDMAQDERAELTPEAVAELGDQIYAQLHCRLPYAPQDRAVRGGERLDAMVFAQGLSDANCGTGSWEGGWIVRAVEADGRVVAENLGVRFWCGADGFRSASGAPRVGERGRVFVPKEQRQLMPGFYMVTGDADDDLDYPNTLRIYWNVAARGAIPLVRRLTRDLNSARVPFRFKAPSAPTNYGRADAGVLYLPRRSYGDALPLLADISASIREHVPAVTSAFVKRIAPGVGLAEDPGDGSSFGQHRSALLAKALSSRELLRASGPVARTRALRAMIRECGYDPDALYLNPGSVDSYESLEREPVRDA